MTTNVISQDRPSTQIRQSGTVLTIQKLPGFADVVGFGVDGVVILRNDSNTYFEVTKLVLREFSYIAYNDGKGGFGPVKMLLSTFVNSNGWDFLLKEILWYLANLDQR